jgi:hypothetical protein
VATDHGRELQHLTVPIVEAPNHATMDPMKGDGATGDPPPDTGSGAPSGVPEGQRDDAAALAASDRSARPGQGQVLGIVTPLGAAAGAVAGPIGLLQVVRLDVELKVALWSFAIGIPISLFSAAVYQVAVEKQSENSALGSGVLAGIAVGVAAVGLGFAAVVAHFQRAAGAVFGGLCLTAVVTILSIDLSDL